MPTPYSPEQQQRYQSYLNVHLKSDERSLPTNEQITVLEKKNRHRWWLLLLNAAAILFFGYSFFYNITQLGNTLFYILVAVFVINLVLIIYQKKQITELIEYLKWKAEHEL